MVNIYYIFKCSLYLRDIIFKQFIVNISGYDKEHNFDHLQYVGWPDYGAPKNTNSIFLLIKTVRKLVVAKSDNVKILVHCSSGAGRSGTFIALYHLMEMLDKNVINYKRLEQGVAEKVTSIEETTIDVFNTVFNLTKQRCEMVSSFLRYLSKGLSPRIINLCELEIYYHVVVHFTDSI